MSTFGSETIFLMLVGSCAVLVPIFGWWPLIGAVIITYGWTVLLTDANRKFNPDGSRKPQARQKHGRSKRNSGRSGDLADR